ncbi:MAG: tetratricopeptide repeat protein [Phocaeicola plebeius]|nr:tetratricopeptide repeat protein [Phocaeicola plebeius]
MNNMRRSKVLAVICLSLLLLACGAARRPLRNGPAVEQRAELSAEEQRKLDYFFLEALRMKEKEDYSAAFALMRHCLNIQPRSGAVLYELSRLYMGLGQDEQAETSLKKAIEQAPDNYWYKQTLATYYQVKREVPKTIAVYEDMAEQFPTRLEPLISLTELYTRTQQYDRAVEVLDRLEELDGKSEQLSMEKFRMYLLLDNREQAFTEIESLSKEYPYDMRYKTILGDVYMNNGKPEEAYRTYQEILQEVPGYAPALLSMANYYQQTGNDSLYQLQLDTILLNDDVETTAKLNILRQFIAKAESEHLDSTQVIALFDKVLERPQPNADVPMLYSQYLLSKRMDRQSEPVLEQILRIEPDNKPARLQLMSFAIGGRRLDDVIRLATPALEYHPEALEFYYYLGLAHYQKDETDQALKVFQRGVRQINVQSDKNIASDFYSILGDLYHQKGMSAEAYAAYDSSLVYNPNNIATMNNYAYYLSVERVQLDKAEEMSYKTVKAEPENGTYLDTYAWILFEKGRYTEARLYIDQALRNGGDSSQVVVEHGGDIYYHIGEKQKALEYWIKADAIGPDTSEGATPRPEAELKRLKQKIRLKKYVP